MSHARSLEEIKVDLDLICLDIENLDDRDKITAVNHLQEGLSVLKLGSSLNFDNPLSAGREKNGRCISEEVKVKSEPAVEGPGDRLSVQNTYNGLVPTCEECGHVFPTLGTLDTHITNSHQQPSVKVESQQEFSKDDLSSTPFDLPFPKQTRGHNKQ